MLKNSPAAFADSELAPWIAELYAGSPPLVRVRIVSALLEPLGTLALVAVAAGAFARFLPAGIRGHNAIAPHMLEGIGEKQVHDLARYVEQKSPEVLTHLSHRLGAERHSPALDGDHDAPAPTSPRRSGPADRSAIRP